MTKVWNPDLQDPVLNESAWERQMQMAGLEAFEKTRDGAEAAETTAGQRLLRKLVRKAEEAISAMQKNVLKINRVERELKATVLVVPADTCALLTLRTLINATYAPTNLLQGTPYQAVCRDVAKAIELELNFTNWLRESKEAAKAYAEANGLRTIPKSNAERLLQEHGMDARSLRRWKHTFEALNRYKWDTLEEHYCGEAMVATVVEALPEVFAITNEFVSGRQIKHIHMTEEARRKFDETEARIARMQVVKKPMLTRPKRWVADVR